MIFVSHVTFQFSYDNLSFRTPVTFTTLQVAQKSLRHRRQHVKQTCSVV